MIRDLTESIAELIYSHQAEGADLDTYLSWDELAENVQEVYVQLAEEIVDMIDEESLESDIDLVLDDEEWTE